MYVYTYVRCCQWEACPAILCLHMCYVSMYVYCMYVCALYMYYIRVCVYVCIHIYHTIEICKDTHTYIPLSQAA